MKEWLAIDPDHEGDWLSLAEEALAFVGPAQTSAIRGRNRP